MSATGFAELPLHDGHVPRWMARLMRRLAKAIVEVIVEEYGPRELVVRLSDPFWFQALNNAIGMDWDSSGSTTVTTAILRQVLEELDVGVVAVGGKGRLALSVPDELRSRLPRLGLGDSKVEEVVRSARLAAKTDSVLLQDGYQLYHQAVFVAEDGTWTVIQQGMNVEARLARRYHWLGPRSGEASLEPHTGVVSARREETVLDLTSRRSVEARKTILDLAREPPRKTLSLVYEAYRLLKGVKPITAWIPGAAGEERRLPERVVRFYRPQPRPPMHIARVLERLYETQPRTVDEMVLVREVGPAVVRSLALVAELVYGVEASHDDPAVTDPFRYSFVVGGKDGVPFPFNRRLAEKVIEFLEEAVRRARLGDREKLAVLRRLRSLLPPNG